MGINEETMLFKMCPGGIEWELLLKGSKSKSTESVILRAND